LKESLDTINSQKNFLSKQLNLSFSDFESFSRFFHMEKRIIISVYDQWFLFVLEKNRQKKDLWLENLMSNHTKWIHFIKIFIEHNKSNYPSIMNNFADGTRFELRHSYISLRIFLPNETAHDGVKLFFVRFRKNSFRFQHNIYSGFKYQKLRTLGCLSSCLWQLTSVWKQKKILRLCKLKK
jgi:hypothetical protein